MLPTQIGIERREGGGNARNGRGFQRGGLRPPLRPPGRIGNRNAPVLKDGEVPAPHLSHNRDRRSSTCGGYGQASRPRPRDARARTTGGRHTTGSRSQGTWQIPCQTFGESPNPSRPQPKQQQSKQLARHSVLLKWGMHLTPVATRTSGVFSRKKGLPMSSRGTRRSSRARSAAPNGAEGSLGECSRAAGPRTPLPHRHQTSEKRDPSTSRTLRSG